MVGPALEASKTKGITIVAVADVVRANVPTTIVPSITTYCEIGGGVRLLPTFSIVVAAQTAVSG